MGTRHRGPEEETRALDAFIKLMRAADALAARVHQHLAADKLTESQLGVLEALFHAGPLCQRDLAEKLLKSGGNLTMVVGNLERRGLVHRDRDPDDRRYVRVRLTEAGRQTIERVFPRHVARIVAELGRLSPAEQNQLGRLCRRLGRAETGQRNAAHREGRP